MKISSTLILTTALLGSLGFMGCSDDETTPTGLINPGDVSAKLNDFTTMFGSIAGNQSKAISISSKYIYTVGATNAPIKLFANDNNSSYFGGQDGVIYKQTPNGDMEKVIVLGGAGDDIIYDIALDGAYYYVFGQFSTSMSIENQSVVSTGATDLFVAKFYENNDSLVMLRSFGGQNTQGISEQGVKMIVNDKYISLFGYASNAVYPTQNILGDFDTWALNYNKAYFEDTSLENEAFVISHFNILGSVEGSENLLNVATCGDQYILVGTSNGNFVENNHNPDSVRGYSYDGFVVSIDDALNLQWGRMLGRAIGSDSTGAVTCENGKVYTGSMFTTQRLYDYGIGTAYYLELNVLNQSSGATLQTGNLGVYGSSRWINNIDIVDGVIYATGGMWGSFSDWTIFSHPQVFISKWLPIEETNWLYPVILEEIGSPMSSFGIGDTFVDDGALFITGQVENGAELGDIVSFKTDLIEDANVSWKVSNYVFKRRLSYSSFDYNASVIGEVSLITTQLAHYYEDHGSYAGVSVDTLNFDGGTLVENEVFYDIKTYALDQNITDISQPSIAAYGTKYLKSNIVEGIYYDFVEDNTSHNVFINVSSDKTFPYMVGIEIEKSFAKYFKEGTDGNESMETGNSVQDAIFRIKLD